MFEGHEMRGLVDVPPRPGKHPAILIVHGAGSTDVFHGEGAYNGRYDEMRAAFRSVGVATVVWDKAGDGCSGGRYIHPDDIYGRADEVHLAIQAVKRRADIDASRIGLWAISHGGWVAPMVAVRTRDVAFLILVSSPAKDFYSTWGYQAHQQLRADSIPEAQAREAIAVMHRALNLSDLGASFEEFSAAVAPLRKYPVFREKFGLTGGTEQSYAAGRDPRFSRTWTTSADRFLADVDVPVLALFGNRDIQVDWRQSVEVFRDVFAHSGNQAAKIKVFRNADHNLFAARTKDAPPRFVNGYLATMAEWLQARGFAQVP